MRKIVNHTNEQQFVRFSDGSTKFFLSGEEFESRKQIVRHSAGLKFFVSSTGAETDAFSNIEPEIDFSVDIEQDGERQKDMEGKKTTSTKRRKTKSE